MGADSTIPNPHLGRAYDQPPYYDYTAFGRRFLSYKWYKPLLVGLLTFVFLILLDTVLVMIAFLWVGTDIYSYVPTDELNYESVDFTSGPGVFLNLGALAVMLPALALAALVVGDRPFSSYTTSRGGWNWGAFIKSMGVAAIVICIPIVVMTLLAFDDPAASSTIRFDIPGFLLCIVLTPLQCIAEEYIFRGYCMQTFGGWCRIPVIAIIAQAFLFTMGHVYDVMGMSSVMVSGLAFGAVTWQTRGIEASSAAHIANNLMGFMLVGFGCGTLTSTTTLADFIFSVTIDVVFAAVIIFCAHKFNWFEAKGDGTLKYNENAARRLWMAQSRMQLQHAYPSQTPYPVAAPPQPTVYPATPTYPQVAQYPGFVYVEAPQYPDPLQTCPAPSVSPQEAVYTKQIPYQPTGSYPPPIQGQYPLPGSEMPQPPAQPEPIAPWEKNDSEQLPPHV